jgi:predicted ATPase
VNIKGTILTQREAGASMARKYKRIVNLPAPYLKRVWLDPVLVKKPEAYPFCLPFLRGGLDLAFEEAITIIVGENGSGKSTLLEGIAALAGFDGAGGGKGYRPVDHSQALEVMGGVLAHALRASWLPKITGRGWFFRAESFFSVARYLDEAARDANEVGPNFLSHSHGEGFLRFFNERCQHQGLYIFDEPESALSPSRQVEFLKLLHAIKLARLGQVIMATHSPLLMAYPGARLLRLSKEGLSEICVEETEHFRMMREFWSDPEGFMQQALTDADEADSADDFDDDDDEDDDDDAGAA